MIRKILIPKERKIILELPEAYIGKEVEVLAFEVILEESSPNVKNQEQPKQELKDITITDPSVMTKEERIAYLEKKLDAYSVDMSGFKFDRDEANDYE